MRDEHLSAVCGSGRFVLETKRATAPRFQNTDFFETGDLLAQGFSCEKGLFS